MPFIVLAEPKQAKELEKRVMQEISSLGIWPVCYYSQPHDFGHSIFFRATVFADEADKERLR